MDPVSLSQSNSYRFSSLITNISVDCSRGNAAKNQLHD
jgi:hypothetical protein